MWTDDFKDKLEQMKEEKQISNYKNYSTPKVVNFSIKESSDGIKCDEKNLKLFKYIRTSNMVLFTDSSRLRKFNNTIIIDSLANSAKQCILLVSIACLLSIQNYLDDQN